MLLSRSSLAARAAAFATAAVIFTGPAFAQQAKVLPVASTDGGAITASTDCKTYKPGELMADTKCEILKGQLVRAQNACIDELVKFKKAEPERYGEMGFGKVTRETACTFASQLPKRAASLQ